VSVKCNRLADTYITYMSMIKQGRCDDNWSYKQSSPQIITLIDEKIHHHLAYFCCPISGSTSIFLLGLLYLLNSEHSICLLCHLPSDWKRFFLTGGNFNCHSGTLDYLQVFCAPLYYIVILMLIFINERCSLWADSKFWLFSLIVVICCWGPGHDVKLHPHRVMSRAWR